MTGLPTPQAIKDATVEYQQDNDLLGKFLKLCVARVPGEAVGARPLHRVFAAWQTWAGLLAADRQAVVGEASQPAAPQERAQAAQEVEQHEVARHRAAVRPRKAFCEETERAALRPVERDLPAAATSPAKSPRRGARRRSTRKTIPRTPARYLGR
jgi:phage/plasmid-associated DNA primase